MADASGLVALARDTSRIAAAVAAAAGAAVTVDGCELVKIWRRDAPSSLVVAGYRITFSDSRAAGPVVASYTAHLSENASRVFDEWREQRLAACGMTPALVHAPDSSAVLFAFPHDPEFPALADAFTAESIQQCLTSGLGRAGSLAAFSVEPLKHDPGRACTCRVALTSSAGERATVIAKVLKGDRLSRTFATMSRLAAQHAAGPGSCRVARPLHYDERRHVLWQEALPGAPFWTRFAALDVAAVFRGMARCAAALHALRFAPAGRALDPLRDDPDQPLRNAPTAVAARHAVLVDRARAALASMEPLPPASLHGDFHPGQFLIEHAQLALTDFDSAGWGDPAYDAGRFISHVYLKAIERDLEPGQFESALESFCEEYLRHAPVAVTPRRIRVHAAAQLAGRRAHKVLRQDAAGTDKLEHLLHIAEAHLA